jgi:hypothetical protein
MFQAFIVGVDLSMFAEGLSALRFGSIAIG